ncbi:hypothetical protein ScPMuIL_017496 [Solemya velum]
MVSETRNRRFPYRKHEMEEIQRCQFRACAVGSHRLSRIRKTEERKESTLESRKIEPEIPCCNLCDYSMVSETRNRRFPHRKHEIEEIQRCQFRACAVGSHRLSRIRKTEERKESTRVIGNGFNNYWKHYNTSLTTVDVTVRVVWETVFTKESFLLRSTAMKFCNMDFDIILITEDLTHYASDITWKRKDSDTSLTLFPDWSNECETEMVSLHVFSICRKCLQNIASDWLCGQVKLGDEMYLPVKESSTTHQESAIDTSRHFKEEETLLAKNIFKFIVNTDWKMLSIIYDNANANVVALLSERLERNFTLFTRYNFDVDGEEGLIGHVGEVYETMVSTKSNFMVVCQSGLVKHIIKLINTFSEKEWRKSAIGHFSKWAVFPSDLKSQDVINFQSALQTDALHINNLVLVEPGLTDSSLSDNRTNYCTSLLEQPDSNPIWTLVWTGEGRVFKFVSSVGQSETLPDNDIFPNIQYGFNQKKLLITTNMWSPFVMKKVVGGLPYYEGLCIDMLEVFASKLNFTYELVEPADGEWGRINNGTWTGVIGQLVYREVDMSFSPISVQPRREMSMDFVNIPFFYDYTTVVLKKPDPNERKWRTFVDPFQWPVHVGIGAAFLIVSVLLELVEKYSTRFAKSCNKKTASVSATDDLAFWYLLGALFNEGGVYMPKRQSSRTLVAFWWLFCTAVVGYYLADLTASLSVAKFTMPFESLEEMVQQTDFTWGTIKGTAWDDTLSASNLPVYKAVWRGIVDLLDSDPEVLDGSIPVHIAKVLRGGYALIMDKTQILLNMAENCELDMTGELFMPLRYAIGLPNNSPFNNQLTVLQAKIIEGGLVKIWEEKWWPKNTKCQNNRLQGKAITLVDIQGVFYFAGGMLVLCPVVLLVEIVVHRSRPKRAQYF